MKVNIEDIEKSLKWLKENSFAVSVSVEIKNGRHLIIKAEDKYARQIEITVYSVDKDERSLLKPTIQKTEQL